MKKQLSTLFLFIGLIFSTTLSAQKNPFLERNFWNSKPAIEEIQQLIDQGNDPAAFNNRHFDPVVMAIFAGNPVSTLEFLLNQEGNSVDKKTHDARTYLFWAAYRKDAEAMAFLIDKGSDVNAVDDHGLTVIQFAANGGLDNPELYEMLIDAGADINQENDHGATVLLLAAPSVKNLEIFDYFKSKELDLNAVDEDGNNAFFYASKSGRIEILDWLIEHDVEYNYTNELGETPFFAAASGTRSGSAPIETFKYLEEKEIPVNVTSEEGKTPLLIAAQRTKDIRVLEFLIERGLNPNDVDKAGNNALILAAERSALDNIKMLIGKTKDINHANEEGQTALSFAVKGNSVEAIRLLLNAGAKTNVVDKDGNTLVYYFVESVNPYSEESFDHDKMKILLSKDVNFKKTQANGNTFLHLAVQNGNPGLVNAAIKQGVKIDALNNDEMTALQLAALQAKNVKVLLMLVESGADKSIKTTFGETAYDLASENELLKKQNVDLEFLKP